MTYQPIPSTELQVILNFAPVDSNSISPHPLAGPAGSLYRAFLISQVEESRRPTLQKLLTTPLQQLFDELWTSLNAHPDPTQRPAVLVSDGIKGTESRAYAINVAVPPKGVLVANYGDVSIGMREQFPAQQPGHQLNLVYRLPGFSSTFNVTTNSPLGSWADPRIKLTFDGSFEVRIAVPSNPRVPLGISTVFLTSNLNISGDTIWSSIEIGISKAVNKIGQILTSSTGGGGALPGTSAGVPVPQLLNDLSSAFTIASKYGFTTLDVKVNPNPLPGTTLGTTVELILTHPQTPGPEIGSLSALATPPSGPIVKVDHAQVHTGDSLTVRCSNILTPMATAARIYGKYMLALDVELQYGTVDSPDAVPATTSKVYLHRDASGTLLLQGLVPSKQYAVRARNYDIPSLIATQWGPWLYIKTGKNDDCLFRLINLAGQDIARASIGIGSVTSVSTNFTIPDGTIRGTYTARVTPRGAAAASDTFQVVAPNTPIPPSLFVKDANGQPETSAHVHAYPQEFFGLNWVPTTFTPPFTLAGIVELYIDSEDGQKLENAGPASPDGSFSVKIKFERAMQAREQHKLIAVQKSSGLRAECNVFYQGPPT